MAKNGLKIFFMIVLVLVVGLAIAFFIISSPPGFSVDRGIPDKGVDILQIPLSVDPGEEFEVSWRVLGLDNVEYSILFYSTSPQENMNLYENLADGTLADGKYSATITAPSDGALFIKIMANDGSDDYWSEEFAVRVLEE